MVADGVGAGMGNAVAVEMGISVGVLHTGVDAGRGVGPSTPHPKLIKSKARLGRTTRRSLVQERERSCDEFSNISR
jgi:hypothetical protein